MDLFRLAWPVAVGMGLQALYNLVDAFWLGRWTRQALAAQSMSMPFFFLVFALVQAFATAGSSVVAQYTGAGRHYDADRAAAQMFLMLGAVAVVLTVPLACWPCHAAAGPGAAGDAQHGRRLHADRHDRPAVHGVQLRATAPRCGRWAIR